MKTRKLRLLSALLALAMLLALLPTAAFADTVYGTVSGVPSGNCGAEGNEENVHWTLDSDGTLTISGAGEMAGYWFRNSPWYSKRGQIKEVVIGDGITSIGKCAFYNCNNVTEVTISEGVETIGEYAFSGENFLDEEDNVHYHTPQITEIKIPSSVKTIKKSAFEACETLRNIDLSMATSLTTIDEDAFKFCTRLEKVDIPANVTTIGGRAFWRCSSLQNVVFEKESKLENIGNDAFSECGSLKEITIPSSVTTIGRMIFDLCSNLEKVTFAPGSKLETIGENAFSGCSKLKTISCDANVKQKLLAAGVVDESKTQIKTYPPAHDPKPETYPITIDYGTAYDAEGNPITKAAAGETVYVEASETALEGMTFERWEVRKGEVKLADDHAAKTSFTMPAGEVQLEAMYQAADVHDSGWDAATVVTGAVIGTGTAILAYHIGMEVYAEQVLGKDVAVPRTRGEVALLAWQLAGSPAVNVEGEPLSEAAQAERWAVESGLMEPDAEGNFNGTKKMSKWNALRTLEKAKQ